MCACARQGRASASMRTFDTSADTLYSCQHRSARSALSFIDRVFRNRFHRIHPAHAFAYSRAATCGAKATAHPLLSSFENRPQLCCIASPTPSTIALRPLHVARSNARDSGLTSAPSSPPSPGTLPALCPSQNAHPPGIPRRSATFAANIVPPPFSPPQTSCPTLLSSTWRS